jgi:putative membrane protein
MIALPLALATEISAAVQVAALALLAAGYARRARTLAHSPNPVPRWRQACFYGGFLVIAAALLSLSPTGQRLLYVQTIEDLLLGDVGALLIVLGLTAPVLEPVLQARVGSMRPFESLLRVLSHPAIAFLLWALNLYAWHLTAIYEAALRNSAVHMLEHAMLLAFGVNMWMCLLGPLPSPRWFGNRAKLVYILVVRLAGIGLGNLLLWSRAIYYPFFLNGDALHFLSPIADQNIAGAIIAAESTIVTLGLCYWLFVRAVRQGEEHRDLIAFARARGVELSEARVASAVSSGRGPELRRRLEARTRTQSSTPR